MSNRAIASVNIFHCRTILDDHSIMIRLRSRASLRSMTPTALGLRANLANDNTLYPPCEFGTRLMSVSDVLKSSKS